MWLVIRTPVDPAPIEKAVRQAIREVDRNQPIVHVATMEQFVEASMARQRLAMGAFDTFAAVALLLATIGIHGVLAGGVLERTREFAMRAAVGASRPSIMGHVGRQALSMTAVLSRLAAPSARCCSTCARSTA